MSVVESVNEVCKEVMGLKNPNGTVTVVKDSDPDGDHSLSLLLAFLNTEPGRKAVIISRDRSLDQQKAAALKHDHISE